MEDSVAYDELAAERESRHRARVLRRPQGRRRDSSIVGIFNDALRLKDGALTVAYQVEMPATLFADDNVIDYRYDELARMLSFDKPAGTLMQFRYATIPDRGSAILRVIGSRSATGTHTLASLLQASNLDYLENAARNLPYRQTVLTMWVRIPPQQRTSSTIIAFGEFKSALRNEIKSNGFACLNLASGFAWASFWVALTIRLERGFPQRDRNGSNNPRSLDGNEEVSDIQQCQIRPPSLLA